MILSFLDYCQEDLKRRRAEERNDDFDDAGFGDGTSGSIESGVQAGKLNRQPDYKRLQQQRTTIRHSATTKDGSIPKTPG